MDSIQTVQTPPLSAVRVAPYSALPRSDPTTDDLKSRVEFAGGTTVIRVK